MKINASHRLKAFSIGNVLTEDHIENLIYDDWQEVQRIYKEADRMKDDDEREQYLIDRLENLYPDNPELLDSFAYNSISTVAVRLARNADDSDVAEYLRSKLDSIIGRR